MPKLSVKLETWDIEGVFAISRSTVSQSYVLVVELTEGDLIGRGECEPHEEDQAIGEKMAEEIYALREEIEGGITRQDLLNLLPKGPARNAIDCAMWDLECKQQNKRAWDIAGIPAPKPVTTAYTLGIDSVEAMADKAAKNKDRALLKIKLNAEDCLARLDAIIKAAPDVQIIIDANEAWSFEQLNELSEPLAKLGILMIEQPLPHSNDSILSNYKGPVPLCADESCLDRTSLEFIKGRYDFVNIKLDKTGGLTEALLLAEEAEKLGLRIMVGCMVGTSLAMAPAMLVAQKAEFTDLDGPLLLSKDRENGLLYKESLVYPPKPELWG